MQEKINQDLKLKMYVDLMFTSLNYISSMKYSTAHLHFQVTYPNHVHCSCSLETRIINNITNAQVPLEERDQAPGEGEAGSDQEAGVPVQTDQ